LVEKQNKVAVTKLKRSNLARDLGDIQRTTVKAVETSPQVKLDHGVTRLGGLRKKLDELLVLLESEVALEVLDQVGLRANTGVAYLGAEPLVLVECP